MHTRIERPDRASGWLSIRRMRFDIQERIAGKPRRVIAGCTYRRMRLPRKSSLEMHRLRRHIPGKVRVASRYQLLPGGISKAGLNQQLGRSASTTNDRVGAASAPHGEASLQERSSAARGYNKEPSAECLGTMRAVWSPAGRPAMIRA
jgi:hypothetical protein